GFDQQSQGCGRIRLDVIHEAIEHLGEERLADLEGAVEGFLHELPGAQDEPLHQDGAVELEIDAALGGEEEDERAAGAGPGVLAGNAGEMRMLGGSTLVALAGAVKARRRVTDEAMRPAPKATGVGRISSAASNSFAPAITGALIPSTGKPSIIKGATMSM